MSGTSIRKVAFEVAQTPCDATLYLPADSTRPGPAIVLGHGLAGTQEMRLDAFAQRFADAGYVAMTFDYRGFGLSGGEPRQLLDIKRQLADWAGAIAAVRAQPEVDAARVAIFGTSFGGGHVLTTAARDASIAAVIAQCPFTSGTASSFTNNLATTARLTARAVLDDLGRLVGRGPVHVDVAGPRSSAALMTAPDAQPGYFALSPAATTPTNKVAARFATRIIGYHPGRSARRITAPVLFAVCATDTVAPAGPTRRYARHVPLGEAREYPFGHFDIYVGDAFETAVADQIDFLNRHLPI